MGAGGPPNPGLSGPRGGPRIGGPMCIGGGGGGPPFPPAPEPRLRGGPP